MMSIRDRALDYLYREMKKAKISLGQAEARPGVTSQELENLQNKIDVFDWLTTLVNKEDV
jgi:hypothetical protein